METEIETLSSGGLGLSGNSTEVFTCSATLVYDDTTQTTGDGTDTKFQFKGLFTLSLSENLKTRMTKATTTFQGTGGGPVRDVPTILTGTITVKASGAPSF
jgi:hypothetical protein